MLAILLKVLPSVFQLMVLAEKYFADKQGAKKKEMVMEATQVLLGGLQEVSTGGQKETWSRISGPIAAIIDNGATIMFPHDDVQRGPG